MKIYSDMNSHSDEYKMLRMKPEQIDRMIRQENIKFIIAILEMCTRVMAAGLEINELVQELKKVLGNLMDESAKDQLDEWEISLPKAK